MNIVIVEDELLTARILQRLLAEIRPAAQVLQHLETVVDTIQWLQSNPAPDLLLMDIHLADGSSFEVFRRVQVTCPVIFITAYNQHALEAFRVNGIDYLLKPLSRDDLQQGLAKFDALRRHYTGAVVPAPGPAKASSDSFDFTALLRTMQQLDKTPAYKTTWLVPHKTRLVPVAADEVAYFAIRYGAVVLTTLAGQHYNLDATLEELESQVDPQRFFRANRQVLFARPSLASLEPHQHGRMLLHLRPAAHEDVIVPKLRVVDLRKWIG